LTADPRLPVSAVTTIQASPHPYARQTLGSTYVDGSVRVWDLHTGHLTAEFVRHHEEVATCLAVSPVSKALLMTGGLDRRVIFFDMLQSKYVSSVLQSIQPSLTCLLSVCCRELRSMEFDDPVMSLALCADGKTLAVGTTTGQVLIYDLRGNITPLFSTIAHEQGAVVNSLEFAPSHAETFSSATVFPRGQPVISVASTDKPMQESTLEALASDGPVSETATEWPAAVKSMDFTITKHSPSSPESTPARPEDLPPRSASKHQALPLLVRAS
jgi:WD40 repeat protein